MSESQLIGLIVWHSLGWGYVMQITRRRWWAGVAISIVYAMAFVLWDFDEKQAKIVFPSLVWIVGGVCYLIPSIFLWDALERYEVSISYSPTWQGSLFLFSTLIPFVSPFCAIFVARFFVAINDGPDDEYGFGRFAKSQRDAKTIEERIHRVRKKFANLEKIEDGIYKKPDGTLIAVNRRGRYRTYKRIHYARKYCQRN